MNIKLHTFPHSNALDEALANSVAASLRAGIASHQMACLVVSGGRTPAGFFRSLAALNIDWSLVSVLLADERCVAEDNPNSNARAVRTHFFQGKAAAAQFIPLFVPEESEEDLNARLATLPALFDAVVLGMGEDGHTASIFPDSPQRDNALFDTTGRSALFAEGVAPVSARITLTAPRLLATRSLFVHITGEAKWSVLGKALTATTPALPISQFLHVEGLNKHVFWTR